MTRAIDRPDPPRVWCAPLDGARDGRADGRAALGRATARRPQQLFESQTVCGRVCERLHTRPNIQCVDDSQQARGGRIIIIAAIAIRTIAAAAVASYCLHNRIATAANTTANNTTVTTTSIAAARQCRCRHSRRSQGNMRAKADGLLDLRGLHWRGGSPIPLVRQWRRPPPDDLARQVRRDEPGLQFDRREHSALQRWRSVRAVEEA